MISKYFSFLKNSKASSLLIVLFYLLAASMIMLTLYSLLLNTSSNTYDTSRYNVARKLAESKIQQVLGASDDLFNCATNQISYTQMKLHPTEVLSCQGTSQFINNEYFGTIQFSNSSSDAKSSVECAKTQERSITNLTIKKYESIRLVLDTNKTLNLGVSGPAKLFFLVEYDTASGKKTFPFIVSSSSTNLQGAIIYNGAGLTQQASTNGYPVLVPNFITSSTDATVSQESIKLYMNFNNLILNGSMGITAVNVVFLDNGGTMSASLPNVDSNFARLSCRAFDNVSSVANVTNGTRVVEMEAIYARNKSLPIYQYFGLMLNNFVNNSSGSELPSVLELGIP